MKNQNNAFPRNLFTRQNIWWTIIPLTLVPLTGWAIGTKIGNTPIRILLALVLISYAFVAFRFPLKPAIHSLFSTGAAALIFAIALHISFRFTPSGQDLLLFFLIPFVILSLVTTAISAFRNKTITS